jgi:hypothetical protein
VSNDERGIGRARRTNHWIYLDRWWAQRLGAVRTAGMYRIRSRELARRFSEEKLVADASGAVFVYRTGPAEKRLEAEHQTAMLQGRREV